MAKQARKLLAVPGTSVPAEHVFSVSGSVVNKLRCSLSQSNVDVLVFLSKNCSFLSQAFSSTTAGCSDGIPSAVKQTAAATDDGEPPLPALSDVQQAKPSHDDESDSDSDTDFACS